MKTKIGVIFGGVSREREVSFAGGRTVYDNLDKSLFEPVPIFLDSFGSLVLLNWEFVYKGSIRDFYPATSDLPASPHEFQIYAESLGELDGKEQKGLTDKIGSRIDPSRLSELIDVAFLCLHGCDGEDGRIQGLLEFYRIPYTGSGIHASSVGINKVLQKELMQKYGFAVPTNCSIKRSAWMDSSQQADIYKKAKSVPGFPLVVKSASQGSSIGISILNDDNPVAFKKAVDKSFFIYHLKKEDWIELSHDDKIDFVKQLCDIREGIGIPVKIGSKIIYHPEEMLAILMQVFAESEDEVVIEGVNGESEVMFEEFIDGKEFSCIVIQNQDGNPIALPPTEIKKGAELFDYRSKYLPGLSRKITPIKVDNEKLEAIRTSCEKLYVDLKFDVYARIDGFIKKDGQVFLNDPNTTSGMLPSSFFFHQAAEIGLNPTQFLTFIIVTSLRARIDEMNVYGKTEKLLRKVEREIKENAEKVNTKKRIAVLMGGYSAERHISVESGRNVFEKLASSEKYQPIPVFLTDNESKHELYTIPVNILLKDNADDIKEKIKHFEVHELIGEIIEKAGSITETFGSEESLKAPELITYEELKAMSDFVFIAMHGRPGEDGAVQTELEKVGLAYNGSNPKTSAVTIDKFKTNEILMEHGFHAASHVLVHKSDWENDTDKSVERIESHFKYPFICKPVDDGCSAAVKMIHNVDELKYFASAIFRQNVLIEDKLAKAMGLKPNEEFPIKQRFMVEELIKGNEAKTFLEITGGLLTHYNDAELIEFEIFEASEALSEGNVLSLEEKFLAGEGQNITPARYSKDLNIRQKISEKVKSELKEAAKVLNIQGYARIDAFVRIFDENNIELVFIEVNSLPGMTPATCIFHQAAINHYKPFDFLDKIIEFGLHRNRMFENT